MSGLSIPVAHQFDDADQQYEAASLGMWVFLATEILFFGGLFTTYAVYRAVEPAGFHEGSRHLDVVLGTLNTALLLTSSLSMALAVDGARRAARRATMGWLLTTSVFGVGFLAIKGYEYAHKIETHLWPGAHFVAPEHASGGFQQFFVLYVSMTGLHAAHMLIGLVVMWITVLILWRTRDMARHATFVEMFGLYWHFVDIVWIFLFPLLYLIDRT